MKRWVRYELPVMVCLWESDEYEEERVTHVVVCEDKLAPARDDHGCVLVYDGDSPGLEPVSSADRAGVHAFAVTNRLDLLPDRRTWEWGEDPLDDPAWYDDDPAADDGLREGRAVRAAEETPRRDWPPPSDWDFGFTDGEDDAYDPDVAH